MLTRPLLNSILRDEGLVRGLADPEARLMIEWLVDRAEEATFDHDETASAAIVRRLCHRARAISRFVNLWCHDNARGAACQLAAVERFAWPLPTRVIDPCSLMQDILEWEERTPEEWAA